METIYSFSTNDVVYLKIFQKNTWQSTWEDIQWNQRKRIQNNFCLTVYEILLFYKRIIRIINFLKLKKEGKAMLNLTDVIKVVKKGHLASVRQHPDKCPGRYR